MTIARRTFLQVSGLVALVGTTGISVQTASANTGAHLTLTQLASELITLQSPLNESLVIPTVIAVELEATQLLSSPLNIVLTYANTIYEHQPEFVVVGERSTQTAQEIHRNVAEGQTTITFTLHEPLEPNEAYTLSLATIGHQVDDIDITLNTELARLAVDAKNISHETVFTAHKQPRPHWAADLGFVWDTNEVNLEDHGLPIGVVVTSTGSAPVPAGTELVYQACAAVCTLVTSETPDGKTRESKPINGAHLHELRWPLSESLETGQYLMLTLHHAVTNNAATPTQASTAWLEAPKTLVPRQVTEHQSTQS